MTVKIGNQTSNPSAEKILNVQADNSKNPPALPTYNEQNSELAINSVTGKIRVDDELKRDKTPADFLQKVLKEQPVLISDENASKVSTVMKMDKKPAEMSRDDYNLAFRRAVYRQAMSGLQMSDDEIKMADKALIDAGLYKTYFNLQGNLDSLRKSHEKFGGEMPVQIGRENIEYARRAGQAVLQYREYQSLKDDAKAEYARRYATEALGGFVQVPVNGAVNVVNGVSEPFRAGERMIFGTNYIPEIPRMQVAERSAYWNKDGRMTANRIGEFTATITFGGGLGSKALATQTGRTLIGIESSYNIGAGLYGKDINQPDENGNARQMPLWERGVRIGGGLFGARQVVKTEISTPNSAVNKLDDIFTNNKPKPQAEMVTSNGFKIGLSQVEKSDKSVSEMRLPTMDEQINGSTIKPKWKEKLGEGQDVDDLQEVGKVGAGMKSKPQHHIFPQEYRKFFEERGFTGERSIDKFVVTLDEADHQAIHGGADWKLARKNWAGEWNRRVITDIKKAEEIKGSKLTFEEIKPLVEEIMREYKIPLKYQDYRGGIK